MSDVDITNELFLNLPFFVYQTHGYKDDDDAMYMPCIVTGDGHYLCGRAFAHADRQAAYDEMRVVSIVLESMPDGAGCTPVLVVFNKALLSDTSEVKLRWMLIGVLRDWSRWSFGGNPYSPYELSPTICPYELIGSDRDCPEPSEDASNWMLSYTTHALQLSVAQPV